MQQSYRSIEFGDGSAWAETFRTHWPGYRDWYLGATMGRRVSAPECRRALLRAMPELVEPYDELCQVVGDDTLAHEFLSLYQPPPYLTGCSQFAVNIGEPLLIRNYDYAPRLSDGLVMWSNWNRPVLAMVDCLWGVLDGINDAGLSVSLAFGGRQVVGDGFGVPIVLRYILETCDTTQEAMDVLRRVPLHMAYNVTVLDEQGFRMTAFCSPDRKPKITRLPLATNFQGHVDWQAYANAVATEARQSTLERLFASPPASKEDLIAHFLAPPLYCAVFDRGYGTLYTTVYSPQSRSMDLVWPDDRWRLELEKPVTQQLDREYHGVELADSFASFHSRTFYYPGTMS